MKPQYLGIWLMLGVMSNVPVLAQDLGPRTPELTIPNGRLSVDSPWENSGELRVSGVLLSSPCVLSDFAQASLLSASLLPVDVRNVTLALEGCGEGEVSMAGGLSSLHMAPTVVHSILHSSQGKGRVETHRLRNGNNHLMVSAPSGDHILGVELNYE